MPAPLFAADTNVLIDYAADDEIVIDCFSTIARKLPDSQVFVLPAVSQELAELAYNGSTEQKRTYATKALQSMVRVWRFIPIPIIPVWHGVAQLTAEKIRSREIIPEDEINDSLIVAEAALAKIAILLSNDSHLRDSNQADLKELLEACDLQAPAIFSPHRIVKTFFKSAH